MSRSARITRFFGDGDHDFALLIGQLEELQEDFDCGLEETRTRLADIRVKDIFAVLRLGLIGGAGERQEINGRSAKDEAYRLCVRNVKPGELAGCAILAMEVVNAAIAGVEDEGLGELAGERIETLSPEENSSSLTSTAPEWPAGSAPARSDAPPSGTSEQPPKGGPRPTEATGRRKPRRRNSTTKT